MSIDKQALREAAEKATPGRIGDRIDGSGSIKYQCLGYDGSLVLKTDHKNMEYGFIGDNARADELFFRLCVPDVVLALLDELEAAEKRIADLTAERDALREGEMGDAKHSNTRAAADVYFQLVEECEISAGGSLVGYVDDMRQRIAGLESRTLTVKLPDDGLDDCYDLWGPEQCRNNFDCGYNFSAVRHEEAFREACAAAGIHLKVEE